MLLTRRRFFALLPAPLAALVACGGDDAPEAADSASPASQPTATPASASGVSSSATPETGASNAQLAATPACGDADDLTIAQTEGPYFIPDSPERASLVESGMAGTRLVLEGFVLTQSCQPVARALVDFWQCDNAGNYDNTGYRLRGHQFTDASGRFRLETIVPGLYPGRTRHIHVKVQAPNRPVLTTQLYFPNEAGNRSDGIFNADLLLENYNAGANGNTANFDFVIDA
jgi:protocatechuate 3,4-dioxygenase beta subunit